MATMELIFFLLLSHAPHLDAQPGFISIDCGIPEGSNYTDKETGIHYTSDVGYIKTGLNQYYKPNQYQLNISRQYLSMRSFPYGYRNCYTLQPLVKGNKYLVRASFMYQSHGTEHGRVLPEFDLYFEVNLWTTVRAANASGRPWWTEIITVATANYASVCLVRKSGNPFISVLELRPLEMDMYNMTTEGKALVLQQRIDFGSSTGKVVRYRDDKFDRIWEPGNSENGWNILQTSLPIEGIDKFYQPPYAVMNTGVSPANNGSIYFNWTAESPETEYYLIWHGAELERLSEGQVREYSVCIVEIICIPRDRPKYLTAEYGAYGIISGLSQYSGRLEKTEVATLPPLHTALELYKLLRFYKPPTYEKDAVAMMEIRRNYEIKKNWMGDPCFPPSYKWEGIRCSYNGDNPPRVISIDLSNSKLNGSIVPSIGNLMALTYLDLSGNDLTGGFPEFLSTMPTLSYLNISQNNLSGSVPLVLLERSRNGSLELSVIGNPTLCKSESCTCLDNFCKKRRTIIVSVAVGISLTIFFFITFILFWNFRRRRPRRRTSASELDRAQRIELLKTKNQQFDYSEVINITNNFERVIGRGGFATVYYGQLRNGKHVAAKVLSHSFQGSNEFQTEAELLMRVHHKNLVRLIGYCLEDNEMILVLEYMSHGNLGKALSAVTSGQMILSWAQRLRIALDVAQGLEYLHTCCKPPIIHRDVKTSNILLNEKMEAKIADFGLSKAFIDDDCSRAMTKVKGTLGYLDPEYFVSSTVTDKTDVYSFGVVLLELLTGRPPIIEMDSEKIGIVQYIGQLATEDNMLGIIDARLDNSFDHGSATKAIALAIACTASKSIKRPRMSYVVQELKECLVAHSQKMESSSSQFVEESDLDSSGDSSLFFPSPR